MANFNQKLKPSNGDKFTHQRSYKKLSGLVPFYQQGRGALRQMIAKLEKVWKRKKLFEKNTTWNYRFESCSFKFRRKIWISHISSAMGHENHQSIKLKLSLNNIQWICHVYVFEKIRKTLTFVGIYLHSLQMKKKTLKKFNITKLSTRFNYKNDSVVIKVFFSF